MIADALENRSFTGRVEKGYSRKNDEHIKRLHEEKIGGKIQFDIQLADNHPVGANGKYKIVGQSLSLVILEI